MFLERVGPAIISLSEEPWGAVAATEGPVLPHAAGHLRPGGLPLPSSLAVSEKPTKPATPGQGLLKVTLFPGMKESNVIV